MSIADSFRQGRGEARAKRGQMLRGARNTPTLRGTIPVVIELEEYDPPPPPGPPLPPSPPVRTAGPCRVHGTRYKGCPLDRIEGGHTDSGGGFWEIICWIVAVAFLASVFG